MNNLFFALIKLSLNEAGHALWYLTEYCVIVDNSNNIVGNITVWNFICRIQKQLYPGKYGSQFPTCLLISRYSGCDNSHSSWVHFSITAVLYPCIVTSFCYSSISLTLMYSVVVTHKSYVNNLSDSWVPELLLLYFLN